MWMLMIALLLTALKYLEVGLVAQWSWWWLLLPYGLAALWWAYTDVSGLAKRRAAAQDEERKRKRIQRQKDAMDVRRPR